MSIRCEYCSQSVPDGAETCPHCGAPVYRAASGSTVPQTIEELRDFCALHHLPLEQMRFFIGQDYREPRAFGVYQDERGDFVVYKNKSDGSRAVRYQGPNEAHAVRELYEKMKAEIQNQRARNTQRVSNGESARSSGRSRPRFRMNSTIAYILVFLAVVGFRSVANSVKRHQTVRDNGYYVYQDDTYYRQGNDLYLYDDDLLYWVPAMVDEELADNYSSYYEGADYSSSYGAEDFSDSSYYEESGYSSSSSDWDDDHDWDWDDDFDSWDSGSMDWDSDW